MPDKIAATISNFTWMISSPLFWALPFLSVWLERKRRAAITKALYDQDAKEATKQ
jgi:hypothetical protein